MSDDPEDPLMKLAKLALHADPRVRDTRKIERQLHRKPSEIDIIRCVCKEPVEKVPEIYCDVCQCLSHAKCVGDVDPDPNASWVCPFCQNNESTQYLISQGVDIVPLMRSVFDMRRRAKNELFSQSARNLKNSIPRLHQTLNWSSAFIKRDDVYQNLFKAASKCMISKEATNCASEMNEERNTVHDMINQIQQLTNQLENLETPLMDGILDVIMTFVPDKEPETKEKKKNVDELDEQSTG